MKDKPPLLFMVHRIPYPPNKGDKLRSFNLLRELASRYRVYLGTFIDDPDDAAGVEALTPLCAEICAVRLRPLAARLFSVRGLLSGEAFSVPYYRSTQLRRWVDETVRRFSIRNAIVFSGPMAQYLSHPDLEHRVIDFCDVDSAKWTQYAAGRRFPMSWIYRREGRKLAEFEQDMAAAADASVFATEDEAGLFTAMAPELRPVTHVIQNGVDTEYFDPALEQADPYPDGGPVLVLTGAMDYWPNVDAAVWFAHDILPEIRRQVPEARFAIVGMNPAPAVRELTRLPGVLVTGKVPDVRPWISRAAVSVAPLRIARGVQNKVLEAMAMARPVVASPEAATGLSTDCVKALGIASSADEWAARITSLLSNPAQIDNLGAAARQTVQDCYSWEANLAGLGNLLQPGSKRAAAVAPGVCPSNEEIRES